MKRAMSLFGPTRGLVTFLAIAAAAAAARADLAWHADLPAALAASTSSGKPVLAVFTAAWDDAAAAGADQVLASSEVEAVVAACFEPVRLDVDAHADEAQELGIEHVPAACVLNADRERLTAFECSGTPAEFVAAAARAAQLAASASQPSAAEQASQRATRDAFAEEPARPSEAASAAVSDKVRQLSSFADGGPAPQGDSNRYADSTGSAFARTPPATDYRSPPGTPTLTRSPPDWPAEPAPSSLASYQPSVEAQAAATPPSSATQPSPDIQPEPAAATPWLAAGPALPEPAGAPVAGTQQPAAPQLAGTAAGEAAAADAVTEKPSAAAADEPAAGGFWAAIQKPWSIFSRTSAKPVVEPPAPPLTMPPALPELRAKLAGSPTAPTAPATDVHGPMPLGLEGYCPVTVVERGSWVEGRPQWGARHRGRTYLFAGPEQQRAFLADPDRYAPALSGDDPVLAFDGGRSEPGRRAFGVTYQARMYLFSSPETRAAFTADPDRFTARVMIAEGIAPTDGSRRF